MILRWLLSKTVRQAIDLCHRVNRIVKAQSDLLTSQAVEVIEAQVKEVKRVIRSGGDSKAIEEQAKNLEEVANKWLKPYPAAAVRENVDMVLVALVVALGIRTFFFQPMAIPTGSMQPTLFGMVPTDLRSKPDVEIPGALTRLYQKLVFGISYYHIKAEADGVFRGVAPPQMVFPLITRQQFFVNDRAYTVWFPPERLFDWAGLMPGQPVRKGDDLIKLKVKSGDRLFADRFTYNFRRPERGEIVIFATHGIEGIQQNTHYIKRLIGLGGEKIQIGNDRHVIINGQRLDASVPHFENLYSFDTNAPPHESRYSGHVNSLVAARAGEPGMASLFPDERKVFAVPEHQYLVFGDNTMNSLDSRYWGSFPEDKIVGKCAFVFWPISERFGWSVR